MNGINFLRYLGRRIEREKPLLLPGAPPPAGYDPDEWRDLQAEGRRVFSDFVLLDYFEDLARGYRPEELARGELDRSASVTVGGQVVRPAAPTLDARTRDRAVAVLAALQRVGIELDDAPGSMGILISNVQAAARGTWDSAFETLAASIIQLEETVKERQAALARR